MTAPARAARRTPTGGIDTRSREPLGLPRIGVPRGQDTTVVVALQQSGTVVTGSTSVASTPSTPRVRARLFDPARGDREACLAVFDGNVEPYFAPDERPCFEAFLDAEPAPYLVLEAESDGNDDDDDDAGARIVACGGVYVVEQVARMCFGLVTREQHGLGLGRLLLQLRIDLATRAAPVERVALSTSQHAAGFFEREGFATAAREPDAFAPGLDRCDMHLALGAGPRDRIASAVADRIARGALVLERDVLRAFGIDARVSG
jgi:hypothetical protein